MSSWIIWLIAAALLLLLEIMTQAVWAFCFAIGCLAALIASFFTDSAAVQAIVVAAGAILSWLLLAPVVRKWEHGRGKKARTGMDALPGRRAVITEDVHPGRIGRARIDGDVWQVRAPGIEKTLHRGEEVTVTGYDSIILTVEIPS